MHVTLHKLAIHPHSHPEVNLTLLGEGFKHGEGWGEPYEAGEQDLTLINYIIAPHHQVSDLKQYLILNDFPSVNEAISQNSNMFKEMQVCRVHENRWTMITSVDLVSIIK